MIEKYKSAVRSGIICGIVLVILSVLYFTINGLLHSGHVTNTSDTLAVSIIFTIVILTLDVFTFFCSGLLSARMASRHIVNLRDAMVIGAITATVGELINLPFTLVLSFVTEYIWPSLSQLTNTSPEVSATISAAGQLVCCFPIMLAVGIIISALGALAYAFVKLKDNR